MGEKIMVHKRKYIFALDKTILKRVPHKLEGNIATSLVSGAKFKYIPKNEKT